SKASRHICDTSDPYVPHIDVSRRPTLAAVDSGIEEQVNVAKSIDIESADGQVDAALVARICWHYFKEGQTQDVIAQRLKITRKRVNRILGEARESGFVQITIAGITGPCCELEAHLVAKFGLRHAVVVPAP